ncbi:MAG TPA: hypothetical protein PLA01_02585 [Acetivibrio sp.]|nr:hypothetical protein [Acetivibrio sp.]
MKRIQKVLLMVLCGFIAFGIVSCKPQDGSDTSAIDIPSKTSSNNTPAKTPDKTIATGQDGKPTPEPSWIIDINDHCEGMMTKEFHEMFEFILKKSSLKIINNEDNSSYDCPFPRKLIKKLENSENMGKEFIKITNLYPLDDIDEQDISETVYTVGIRFGDVEYLDDSIETKYVDVAKIKLKFERVDDNKSVSDIEVISKYDEDIEKYPEDYKLKETYFEDVILFHTIYDLGEEAEEYKGEISCGFVYKDMKVYVSNYRITQIEVNTRGHKTPRGLEVGDSKEKAKELYGLPDIGFYEDDEWKYLFYRDWSEDDSLNVLSDDYFQIAFEDNKVKSMVLSAYIPID